MASGKQYKNVYTILEKVKKGEIKTHYKQSEGLFGKLDFYKKPDLIKPYLHYIDQSKIDHIVETAISDRAQVQTEFAYFAQSSKFKALEADKKPDLLQFHEKLKENYEKFPKHLKHDIFKMYYQKMQKLEFEERTSGNETKYRFLEKANNPVGKIMTEGSNMKSAIFTRNMMMYYLMQMTQLEYIDPEAHDQMQKGLNGDGESDFDSEAAQKAFDKMTDSATSKKAMDRALDQAQETCKAMDENIDKDIQEKMFDQANKPDKNSGTPEAGKMSPEYIRTIAAKLSEIKLSMGALKDKLKKLLDKSASYFSSRKITTYEDLFNATDISGLEDYELLHPKLRKIFAEDVQVKDTKSVGKIDVYIDISGSMSSGCGVTDLNGKDVSRIQFAKSMVAKLKEMDMLNDVYLFDTRLKKYRNDMISISMIDTGGGTTIDVAVQNIARVDRNGIIITDAEDRCHTFTDRAFFIGLNGARFSSFDDGVIAQYSRRNQVVVFDGKTIKKVDEKGHTIK